MTQIQRYDLVLKLVFRDLFQKI